MIPIIRFENVHLTRGNQTLLNDVSLTIPMGETVAIMGASGCGKTTLLRCILGFEKVDSGDIFVNGLNLSQPPRHFSWSRFRSELGMVFQHNNLFPHLTVLDNITLGPIQVKKTPPKEAKEIAFDLLKRVHLENKAHRYPHQLSGGEKQRVAIARALAMSSKLLLLDEPTSALDPIMTGEVLETIRELSDSDLTLLIVTHEVPFALNAADRILFLSEGAVIFEGSQTEFQGQGHAPIIENYLQAYFDTLPM